MLKQEVTTLLLQSKGEMTVLAVKVRVKSWIWGISEV